MQKPDNPIQSPHFGDKLAQAVLEKRTPAIVGIDPRVPELPDEVLRGCDLSCRAGRAGAVLRFSQAVIDQVADLVPAVKVQVAFFECLGPDGMQCLAEVIHHARQKGLVVIVDAKRGDIGSTAEAYAEAYFGGVNTPPWPADALTVNPFLGGDTLEPFLQAASKAGGGIFVLVHTSNPGAAELQDLPTTFGKPVYRHLADWVEERAKTSAGGKGFGIVGAVVGATYPRQLEALRQAMPHAWILVPGYGAQGATAQDVAVAFRQDGLGAIVNSSRGIIFAYRRREYSDLAKNAGWQTAVRKAAEDMIAELRRNTPAGNL